MTQPALIAATPTPQADNNQPYTWAKPNGPRTSRMGRCRTCKAPTLRGLDDDWCAATATATPTPVDPIGELLATLAGLTTYTATRRADRLILTRRDHWAIASRPAGAGDYDVLVEHRCGSPPPAPAIDSRLDRHAPPYDTSPDAPAPF